MKAKTTTAKPTEPVAPKLPKSPEFTTASGLAQEVLTFRGLSITRDRVDLKQGRVLVTVHGVTVWDEPRASKQVNAATRLVKECLRLKNERAKLMDLKSKAGKSGNRAELDARLALLNDAFKLALKRAPLDGVPTEWLLAAAPKGYQA